MRPLPKPAFLSRDVFLICISNYQDPDLRERLLCIVDQVDEYARNYEESCAASMPCLTQPHERVGNVLKKEMISIYERKFVKTRQPGRNFYDRIRNSVTQCPLCAQRLVATLDHYLDKALYPALAVTPCNLVPACSDCNRFKAAHRPRLPEEFTLHPYFDRLGDLVWLEADVVEAAPPAIIFRVEASQQSNPVMMDRLQKHFKVFNLAKLYSAHAAEELSQIKQRLSRIFQAGGAEGVLSELMAQAHSRSEPNPNSWQAAMYRALARSQWFCAEGFGAV